MSSESITMLSGLKTSELTLTKRGANNRQFALSKGGIPMDPEVLNALVATPADGESEFVETLKSQGGVDDKEKFDAAIASFRLQKGMKDLVSDDVMATVAQSAGYEGTAKAVKAEEGVRDDKVDAMSGKVDPKAKKKDKLGKSIDLNELSPDAKAQFQMMMKSHNSLEERAGELEEVVKSLLDQKQEQHYIGKAAKDYGHVPVASDKIGKILKSAYDKSPELAKEFEGILGHFDEVVKSSGLLSTVGVMHKGDEAGGAMSKLEKLAEGMVQKSSDSLSKEQAMDRLMKTKEGDVLYQEYLQENPAQRARSY